MNAFWTISGVVIAAGSTIIMLLQLARMPRKPRKVIQTSERQNCLLSDILDKKIVRIGYFHYPPFISLTANESQPTGFYVELFNFIANKHHLSVDWKVIRLCDTVQAIQSGEIDIVVSIFQTPERTPVVDFTAFMHSIAIGGVVKKSNTQLHSQADLIDSTSLIVVSKGEICHEFVEAAKINKRRLTIIETDDAADILRYVEISKVDVALLDSVSILNYFEAVGNERTSLKPIFRRRPLAICPNCIMLPKKENKLASWLDDQCKEARKQPHIAEIENDFLEKYSGIIDRR